jgi:hypothetical protein
MVRVFKLALKSIDGSGLSCVRHVYDEFRFRRRMLE